MVPRIKPAYLRALKPIEALQNGGGMTARLVCCQCAGHTEQVYSNRPPPEGLLKHFQAKGWDTGRKPLCPSCAAKKPEPLRDWLDQIPGLGIKEPIMAEVTKLTPKPQPTEAAKKAKRLIFMALEDYYDDAKQCYRDGWTDAKIAAECNASETFVKSIREQDFGPLKEPPELREIRTAIDNLTSEAGKLRSRLDAICKSNGFAG